MCATTAERPHAQLANERALEPRAALQLRRRAEVVHADVRGQRARHCVVAEHDELVDPRRERAHHRHRRGEHRIPRVELLRDEDEPAHQKKSRSPRLSDHASRRFGSSGASSVSALADEADRARRRNEAGARDSARSSPGLTIATARSASAARAASPEHRAPPTASQITADEKPCQTACVTTAQPSPSSKRRYGRGESA